MTTTEPDNKAVVRRFSDAGNEADFDAIGGRRSDSDRDDELLDWTREFHEAMAPYSIGGMYANYLDRDDDGRVHAAYGDNYDRLLDVKNEWDPENLFRLNQNVGPTA